MRDLLSSLSTNLHILVIAMLIVGLGLGMITSTAPGHTKTKQNQPAIGLSTTPSVPPKQSDNSAPQPSQSPAPGPTSPAKPLTAAPGPSEHKTTGSQTSDSLVAPTTAKPPPLQLPCAMCDDTADCPGSCLSQTSLPWRHPQPPITVCCGGRKVSIAYQPDFVICPTTCIQSAT